MDESPGRKILWVGPGMGNIMHLGPWPKAFFHLKRTSADPLRISYLKMLDLIDRPKLFYGENLAQEEGITQESARGDFFAEQGHWDIIILDFLEAWQFGKTWWPELSMTPYDAILREWELSLLHLRPYQVWVRHDAASHSTIIPTLSPDYDLVVDVKTTTMPAYPRYISTTEVSIDSASYWNEEAAEQFRFLHVWQLSD